MLKLIGHEKTWSTPDGWTIVATDESIQVFDTDEEPVIETITKESALKKLDDHMKSQENHATFELMMAALKDPIEA